MYKELIKYFLLLKEVIKFGGNIMKKILSILIIVILLINGINVIALSNYKTENNPILNYKDTKYMLSAQNEIAKAVFEGIKQILKT